MSSSHTTRLIHAPRARVFRAFTDPEMLATWQVPDGMTARMHQFDPRPGGGYSMSLFYSDSADDAIGKSGIREDRYTALFEAFDPPKRIVETILFDSPDPAFAGPMTIVITLDEVAGETNLTMSFENIPPGIRPEDNELGTRQSLEKLARLVE